MIRGSYLTLLLFASPLENRALELNGARSNPQAGVELFRLGALHDELLRRSLVDPRLEKMASWLGLESIEFVRERSLSPARKDHAVVEPASLQP